MVERRARFAGRLAVAVVLPARIADVALAMGASRRS
jgi:hypothetical protein